MLSVPIALFVIAIVAHARRPDSGLDVHVSGKRDAKRLVLCAQDVLSEAPGGPERGIQTHRVDPDTAVDRVFAKLEELGYL